MIFLQFIKIITQQMLKIDNKLHGPSKSNTGFKYRRFLADEIQYIVNR